MCWAANRARIPVLPIHRLFDAEPLLSNRMRMNQIEPSIRSLVRKSVTNELHPLTIVDEVLHRLDHQRDNPIFISTTPPDAMRRRAEELGELSADARSRLPL